MTDRFTAEMHIRVPQGMRCSRVGEWGFKVRDPFEWQAGRRVRLQLDEAGISGNGNRRALSAAGLGGAGNVKVYVTIAHQASANQLAQTATSEYNYFTDEFGLPPTPRINIVELPDDTLPAVYAPELAAIMGSRIGDKSGVRLLANTIAHQWWGLRGQPKNS